MEGRLANRTSEWLAGVEVIWKIVFFFSLRWVTFALQLCDHCFFFSQCSRRKKSTVLTVLNETVARIIFVTWAQREGGCDRSSLSPYTTCSFICTRQGEKYILCDHSQPDFCHLLLVPSKSAPKKDKGDTRSVSLRDPDPEKCAPPRSSMFIIYNHCESKAEPQLYRSKWCHRVQSHLYVSVSDASHIW